MNWRSRFPSPPTYQRYTICWARFTGRKGISIKQKRSWSGSKRSRPKRSRQNRECRCHKQAETDLIADSWIAGKTFTACHSYELAWNIIAIAVLLGSAGIFAVSRDAAKI